MPRQKRYECSIGATKNPRGANSWVFLFRFCKVAYALGWLPILVIAIQPFANVVGNYTRHDRNDKRYEYIHEATPPSVPVLGVATS